MTPADSSAAVRAAADLSSLEGAFLATLYVVALFFAAALVRWIRRP